MTIGELLRAYRLEKGVTQKQFADNIVSTSYYSKVEKSEHRITAEDLIAILEHNNIGMWSFFRKLSLKGDFQYSQHTYIEDAVMNAYYNSNKKQLENIKHQVEHGNIPNKEELSLIISGWIECMKTDQDLPDVQVREELKEKIFNVPSIDLNKLTLFCNFMEFYDLDSNFYITKQAISKCIDSTDADIQEALLSIISNLLYLSIKEGNYNYTDYLLQNAQKISMKPRLFLAKMLIALYGNLIKYHFENKQIYIDKCRNLTETIKLVGMESYSNTLNKVIDNYIK